VYKKIIGGLNMDKEYILKMEKIYKQDGFEVLIQNLSHYLAQNDLSQQYAEELVKKIFDITAGGGDYFDTSAGILFKKFYERFPDSKILKEHFENIKQELLSNGNDYFLEKNVSHDIQEFTRTQIYKNKSTLEKIDMVIKNTINSYNEDNKGLFEKIIIDACCISSMLCIDSYFIDKDKKIQIKYNLDSFDLMNDVKKEMYEQAKHEGAWFSCKIELLPSLEYSITFYYDDKNKNKFTKERFKTPDYVLSEFQKFPRSKEFTPEWWQNILGKKAKYIKK
jgi:hypothetical protein